MEDGESAEFWYAYHAYHTHGMTPSTFAELPRKERMMIIAFIDIKAKEEEKQARKNKRK